MQSDRTKQLHKNSTILVYSHIKEETVKMRKCSYVTSTGNNMIRLNILRQQFPDIFCMLST
jgi:hypothetical protein